MNVTEMRNLSEQPVPKFKPGDNVEVVGPGSHRGRRGFVEEITRRSGDMVFKYQVRFGEGAIEQFFGFELALIEEPS